MLKVAVIVGSLRRESINRRFALALAKLAEGTLEFQLVELGDVPMYNEDLWQDLPPAVTRLKQDIEAADAVLFVTPEYNRSIPALVKNTIDWGSRPRGQSSWAGKPAGIVGTSGGAIGTAVAQSHLRHIVTVCSMALLPQPEVYLVNKPGLITDSFEVSDENSRAFLAGFVTKFAAWIAQHSAKG
ncbi:MAG TPA: NAD(P)H-dependent oxidoreductase [Burkholderiaceae bacterium]|nr:NAD(P)H-dependent oxidoreductase [Burkholderiaceae bacterium]